MTTTTAAPLPSRVPVLDDDPRLQLERFHEALQPRCMGWRLAAVFRGGPATCHILDAKYEPGVRAIVLYEYAGRLLRGDLLSAADDTGNDLARSGPVVAPGVRLSSFPHDPELPALARVMDTAHLGPVLAGALPGMSGRRGAVRCRTSLLRYRPGKRATILVTFAGEPNRYVAKAYHDSVKASAVADEAPALAACISSKGRLRFAPTVAHVPELSVVVQAAVQGTPLDALLATRGCVPAVRPALSHTAQALAQLHEAAPVTSRQRPVERELHRFGTRARRISSVDPRFGAAAQQLAERLSSMLTELPVPTMGPVHGDCKPSQFLLAGHHVYLMDPDHLGISDQASDVGTFLATLRQLAVRGSLTSPSAGRSGELAELAELFLEAYLRARGDDRSRTRIRWQVAAALERKALRAFARAPHSPLANALVREAERCLDELEEAR